MTIKIKCNKCGETGIRKDQEELNKSTKCKVCGGTLELMKGSVMDVPLEAIVKTGIGMAKDIIKKKQDETRKKVESSFEKMQTTLESILEENKKQTKIMESKFGGSA